MRKALWVAMVVVAGSAPRARGDAGPAEQPEAVPVTRGGAPVVDVDTSARDLELGEPFFAVIRARHPSDVQVGIPDALALGPAIEELRRASASRRNPDGSVTREIELELMAFEMGEVELPPIPVHYVAAERNGRVLTDPVALTVRDPVAEGRAELREIAPPVTVLRRDTTWLFAGAATILGAALTALAWLRRRALLRRRTDARKAPEPAPDEQALARLEALAASGSLDAENRRPAFFEMSEIVRTYLGRRYGFAALDLTTNEIEIRLRERADAEPRELVIAWLRDVDAVKYAGYGAGADEARDTLDRAVDLVLETRGARETSGEASP